VGLALVVVLERLTPAERLAFVLHDMFLGPIRADRIDRRSIHRGDASARQPRPPARVGRGARARR
jgi:RNA polymerase sigma-70 factor (ECF subfamily)